MDAIAGASEQGSFCPRGERGTVMIDVGSTSKAVQLPQGAERFRLYNPGPGLVAFEFGGPDVTASIDTATPIGPKNREVFSAPSGVTHIAVVAGYHGRLYVTAGEVVR